MNWDALSNRMVPGGLYALAGFATLYCLALAFPYFRQRSRLMVIVGGVWVAAFIAELLIFLAGADQF